MTCSYLFVLHSSEKFQLESKRQHAVQTGEGPCPKGEIMQQVNRDGEQEATTILACGIEGR